MKKRNAESAKSDELASSASNLGRLKTVRNTWERTRKLVPELCAFDDLFELGRSDSRNW